MNTGVGTQGGTRHDPRLIVALDFADERAALQLVARLDPARCRIKIGKELFTRAGPDLVRRIQRHGFGVFLDLKFHDIPNTVAAACRAAADLGVWMVNVHASGGPAMLAAAREALGQDSGRPWLTAVTVLTSLDTQALGQIGYQRSAHELVLRLADLAAQAGCDGVVCSAREVTAVRAQQGDAFRLVTPGIRLPGQDRFDQRRILTPQEAFAAGADYLVVGRPVTQAEDPAAMLRHLAADAAADRAR